MVEVVVVAVVVVGELDQAAQRLDRLSAGANAETLPRAERLMEEVTHATRRLDRLLDTLELPITPTQPGADATPPVGTATPTAIAPAATTPAAAKQQRNNTTRKAATRRSRR